MVPASNSNPLPLLDYLAVKCGCMYLSDLRQPRYLFAIRHALRKITPEDFNLWEWNDALQYLTGQALAFESQQQAMQYLMKAIFLEKEADEES